MASDRIFGLVLLVVAVAYMAAATQVQTSFLIDPVGPKTVPILIGAITALCAVIILAKPDPEPEWPDLRTFLRLGFAALLLVGYALALKPLGFVVPTLVASGVLAYQITPRPVAAAITGAALSVGLFVLFKYGLGLGLHAFPRGLLG